MFMYVFFPFLSSLFVSFTTYFVSSKLSPIFSNTYLKLSWIDQRNWDTRHVANLYASVIVPNVLFMLLSNASPFYDDTISIYQFMRSSEHSNIILSISLGYFIADLFMCIHSKIIDLKICIHHIVSISGLLGPLICGWFHFHVCVMLIPEMTTTFVMNRWWLDKMNLKNTKLYFYNGILMLVSWFFARVLIFPYYFIKLGNSVHHINQELSLVEDKYVLMFCVFTYILAFANAIIMCILNIIWFNMMVKGALKMTKMQMRKKLQ